MEANRIEEKYINMVRISWHQRVCRKKKHLCNMVQ